MSDQAPAADSRSILPLKRALAIFAVALAIRVIYLLIIRRTACLDINLDAISDMETFHRWALSIVGGDWLGRGDFHPFHPWQAAVAAKDQWTRWYGHVYHQEPFYPYLIALIYLFAPRAPMSVIVIQLIAGAAGCAFTYLAARRLVSEGTAIAAGGLAVLYGPYLYYESLVLRDSFLIALDALLLWVVLVAWTQADDGRSRRWWVAAGALTGVVYITKASILPCFIGWILLTMWERRSAPLRKRLGPALILTAGFCIAVAPVIARNLLVGAPLLKITTRGPIEFINGNNPWHIGIGWFDGDDRRVSSYAHEILARTDNRLLPTMGAVARSWSADPAGLLKLQLVKAGYFFAPFEMPNNASYSYFRLNCPLLKYGMLSFFWISPFALVGLIVSWRRRGRFAPLYLFLGAGILFTIAFYVIARFRAPLMPAILILAAEGIACLVSFARRAAWGSLAGALLLVGALFAVNVAKTYPDEDLVRPQDYLISVKGYLSRGMQDAALDQAEQGRRLFRGFAEFPKTAARIYLLEGRFEQARAALKEAATLDPADEEVRRELMRLEPPP